MVEKRVGACERWCCQRPEASDPLELQSHMVMSHLAWVVVLCKNSVCP